MMTLKEQKETQKARGGEDYYCVTLEGNLSFPFCTAKGKYEQRGKTMNSYGITFLSYTFLSDKTFYYEKTVTCFSRQ